MKNKFYFFLLISFLFLMGYKEDETISCDTILTKEQINLEKMLEKMPFPSPDEWFRQIRIATKVFIVRSSQGEGGLAQADLHSSFRELNHLFKESRIQFEICQIEYIDDDKYMQFRKQWDSRFRAMTEPGRINIFFVDNIISGENTEICGYTYYPSHKRDYMVIKNACAMSNKTLSHEMGHFFGLYHTHESQFGQELASGENCSASGDLICDTTADPGLRSSIVSADCEYTGIALDLEKRRFHPPVFNIMSYTRRNCRRHFTLQQTDKIRKNLHYFKAHLEEVPIEVSDRVQVVDQGAIVSLSALGGSDYFWSDGSSMPDIQFVADSSHRRHVYFNQSSTCEIFKDFVIYTENDKNWKITEQLCHGESFQLHIPSSQRGLQYILADLQGNFLDQKEGNDSSLYFSANILPQQQLFIQVNALADSCVTWVSKVMKPKFLPKRISPPSFELIPPADPCDISVWNLSIQNIEKDLSLKVFQGDSMIWQGRNQTDSINIQLNPIDKQIIAVSISNRCARYSWSDTVNYYKTGIEQIKYDGKPHAYLENTFQKNAAIWLNIDSLETGSLLIKDMQKNISIQRRTFKNQAIRLNLGVYSSDSVHLVLFWKNEKGCMDWEYELKEKINSYNSQLWQLPLSSTEQGISTKNGFAPLQVWMTDLQHQRKIAVDWTFDEEDNRFIIAKDQLTHDFPVILWMERNGKMYWEKKVPLGLSRPSL